MPELPEVETIVRELQDSSLIGITIDSVHIFWDRTVAYDNLEEFKSVLTHQTIRSITRRGKWIVITLDSHTLLIHLRMTGKLSFSQKGESCEPTHERVRLKLRDGRVLHYQDQRKFGKWYLLTNPQVMLDKLGVEPLSPLFTKEIFFELTQKYSSMRTKPFLLDQRIVCGLGNIYVDEALWLAKIHPERTTFTLNIEEKELLYTSIKAVLIIGIANRGTSLGSKKGNYANLSGSFGNNQTTLNVFRKEGNPCLRCSSIIHKITVAQRGTHICLNCQQIRE